MKKCCAPVKVNDEKFKKAVLIALFFNFSMFLFEVVTSYIAHSSSLKADSLDFLGDSANYIISLYVLSKALKTRSIASLIKGLTMCLFSLWVFADIFINLSHDTFPKSEIMGWTGVLALIVNLGVVFILYKFRDGDSNMQSVWICSRNDAIGNLAVILGAITVGYFNSNLPDIIVAFLMATLAGTSGFKIIKIAIQELRTKLAIQAAENKNCCD